MSGLLRALVLCLCAGVTVTTVRATPDGARAQYEKAVAALEALAPSLTCSTSVNQFVQRSLDGGKVPAHLMASPEALRQFKLAFLVLYLPSMPAGTREMFLSGPMADRQARELGLSEEEFRRVVSSGVLPGAKPAAFMTRRSAEVSIRNDISSLCDAHCMESLRWNLVMAVAAWKSVCPTCTDDFLLTLAIDESLWIDPRVANWLRNAPAIDAASFPFKGDANNVRTMVQPRAYGFTARPDGSTKMSAREFVFEKVDPADPAMRKVCSAPKQEVDRVDVLGRIRKAVCESGSQLVGASSVAMRVHLRPDATSCGSAEEFIGCAHPDSSVELTFQDTRYSFVDVHGSASLVVGPGSTPALSGLAVLMHEVGHWFGLPHLDFERERVPDFMQDTYQDPACMSGLNLFLMVSMSDSSHAARFRKGGGLRKPAGRRQ